MVRNDGMEWWKDYWNGIVESCSSMHCRTVKIQSSSYKSALSSYTDSFEH